MKVQDLMTKTVFCVSTGQSLNEAAQLMWEHNCGSAPVVNAENQLVGMITDRDIAMAAYINGGSLKEIPISAVQSRDPIFCKQDDNISAVELMMQSKQVRRVPVVGENCEAVGIVSLNDIALAYKSGNRAVKSKDLCNTLAAICSPMSSASDIQAVA